ncbi:MAG: hypothetical protein JWP97_5314 [Labilithrix sp.]|nr:hypothetical protein [Labilithrix sp.]
MDPYPQLREKLTKVAAELFAIHGLPIVCSGVRGVPPAGRQGLGTIGFSGPHMMGALALLADESLWHRIAPSAEHRLDPTLLADMVGEFANMLLGGLRTALLPLGADVATAIPAAICADGIVMPLPPGAVPDWDVFDSAGGPLFIRIQVAFKRDFRFSHDPDLTVIPQEAGLVIF